MYVHDGRTLIAHAYAEGYTLPAFNVCSAEMIRACLEAAAELDAPVLLQTYPADIEQLGPAPTVALVRALAEELGAVATVHMDHGPSIEQDLRCLRAGYGSVMLDGADMDLEPLLAATRHLADVAHAQGAAVEVAAESFNAGRARRTRPEDALRLRREGDADMIAVSVGSEHGRPGRLELELLAEIHDAVGGPLVLHGGSGIPSEDYAAARAHGVVKANIGSALYRALRGVWEGSGSAASHREVYARARAALGTVARERIEAMGATGRAGALASRVRTVRRSRS